MDELTKPNIYDFASFASFFAACMRFRHATDAKFSYRHLCRKIGVSSPSTLSMVAANRRIPTPDLSQKLCSALGLSSVEASYAEGLLELQRAKTSAQRQAAIERLASLRPAGETKELDRRTFEIVSNWQHITILELMNTEDFRPDPLWICRRLGRRIKPEDVRQSLEILAAAGLIAQQSDGTWRRTALHFTTSRNVPSDAIRKFHHEVLGLAQEALYLQSVEERYLTTTVFSIDPVRLPAAQDLIAEFRERFKSLMLGGQPRETYSLSIQFFRMTETVEGVSS